MSGRGVVIVGGGQAGLQVAASLRELGYSSEVSLVCAERVPPYQRPPLSKAFLLGKLEEPGLRLRHPSFFRDKDINLMAHDPAIKIDRSRSCVELASGRTAQYRHLVLATGSRNRRLDCEGASSEGVHSLRTIGDAIDLRARLATVREVVVIGGGFIGLEFAAVAAHLQLNVSVVDSAPRALAHAVSQQISDALVASHKKRGVSFHFNETVARIITVGGRVCGVEISNHVVIPADMVVVAVGAMANAELAADAGLPVANGIVVDAFLTTPDPAISAIGDCAAFPSAEFGWNIRLESVQNAVDQAKAVARRITGAPAPYAAVPWFWSDQGDDKLQIVGLPHPRDMTLVKGDPSTCRCSVFYFRDGRLSCVESLNRVSDHFAARALLNLGPLNSLRIDQARAKAFDLKAYASLSSKTSSRPATRLSGSQPLKA